MIRIADQTPSTPPPDDDDVDVGDLRMALHKGNRKWDLLLVVTRKRLKEIMQTGNMMTCLVDNVPGFGQVPPVLFTFLSARTRQGMTPEQVGIEATLAAGAHDHSDFLGILPIVISHEHAAMLRRSRMSAMSAQSGSSMTKHKVPAWERMDTILLMLADTEVQVKAELEKLRSRLGSSTETIIDDDNKDMW